MVKLLRVFLIGLGALLALLAVAVTGGSLWLDSPAGRQAVAARLAAALSQPGQPAVVAGLGGVLPFHVHLDRLALPDRQGVWLTVEDADLDIDTRALWHLTLRIDRLTAARIAVLRVPVGDRAKSAPVSLMLPSLPFGIELGTFGIGRLSLAPGLLGRPVAVSVAARAALHRARATAHLALHRIDGAVGDAALDLVYDPAARGADQLRLTVEASEPTGTLTARFLPWAGALPLHMHLAGAGPIADWHAALTLAAGTQARVAADLALVEDRVSLAGDARLLPLVPQAWRAAAGPAIPFILTMPLPRDGHYRVDALRLHLAGADVTLAGTLDGRTRQIAATAAMEARLGAFSAPAGRKLAGMAEARAIIGGTLDAPRATAELQGWGLDAGGFGVAAAMLHAAAVPAGAGRFHVTATASATGLRQGGGVLPGGLGGTLRAALDLTAAPDLGTIALNDATLAGIGLKAEAYGGVTRGASPAAFGHVALRLADLAPFGGMVGRPLAGGADLDLDLADGADGRMTGTVSGTFSDLGIGVPAARTLLGGKVRLLAVATRTPDRAITLSHLDISGAAMRLTGSGTLDPGGRIALRTVLDLPRLGVLAKPLGARIAGAASVSAVLTGPLGDPGLSARATGRNLTLGRSRLDRLQLDIAADKLSARQGHIALMLQSGALIGRLGASVAEPVPDRLLITGLTLDGPESAGAGALALDLKRRLVSGHIDATIGALGDWSPLLGMKLAGRLHLALDLGAAGGQSADLTLGGAALALGSGTSLEDVTLTAHLSDLLRRPGGTLDLVATDLRAAGLGLARTTLHAASTGDGAIGFSAETAGKWHSALSLTLGGTLRQTDTGADISLSRFAGLLGKLPLRLTQPLLVTAAGPSLRFAGLGLAIGQGMLTGDAQRDARGLTLDLKARNLSLARIARQIGQTNITGTLSLDAHVTGPYDGLAGSLGIAVPDLKLAAADHPELPPLDFTAKATLGAGTLSLAGAIHTLRQETLGFTGSLPFRVAADGGISLPGAAPLTAAIDGRGRLDDIAGLLPLGEDRLDGQFAIDLSIAGTLAHPQAGGHLAITGGSYDSLAAGTTLRDLSLELDGNSATLDLKRLTATDGGTGRLTGTGRVVLDRPGGPALDLGLRLASFTATRLDEATVVASGDVRITGSARLPAIAGALTIQQAEINIPDTLPASVPTLVVQRVDSRHPHRLPPPPPLVPPVVATLKMKIAAPGQIIVRGQGLDSDWQAHLAIAGTSAAPSVTGTITALHGTYAILGKVFTVRQGALTFVGGSDLMPQLDLTAENVASDSTVDVNLKGPADKPVLTLTANPPLPQDEILSRVLFGTGVNQITPLQALQLAQTLAALSGHGGPNLLEKLRNFTGLDQLGVSSSGASGGGGLSGTTVSGGKYIAPGVFVGVDRGVGQNTTRGRIEVELTPHISLDGALGAADTSSNVGIGYHLDY